MNEIHDIVAAPAPGWWPPAPGWWVLTITILLVLGFSIYGLLKWWRNRKIKRLLLQQLQQYDAQTAMTTITLTLKQGCFGYLPRKQVAALHGSAWHDFLLAALPVRQQSRAAALLSPIRNQQYQPQSKADEASQAYLDFAKWWVQQAFPMRAKTLRPYFQETAHD